MTGIKPLTINHSDFARKIKEEKHEKTVSMHHGSSCFDFFVSRECKGSANESGS